MKKNVFLFAIIAGLTLSACSNDDDNNTPEEVNEEEVITTVTLTLVPQGGGDTVVLISNDPNGTGATITPENAQLAADTNYSGVVSFTNITVAPVEDITEEVIEEADEHQVFYIPSGSLNLTAAYEDTDGNGNPLGVLTTMNTGAASTGTLTVVLRHEPNKPNDGTLADAGGETDVTTTFTFTIN